MDAPRHGPRLLRMVVYALLVVSAVASFILDDRLWSAARVGTLPVWMVLVGPIAFTTFAALFAVDRWLQVRRNHYPFARAAFQVGLAVIFVSLLWPHQADEMRTTRLLASTSEPLARLLHHGDPDVRALACEVAGYRRQTNVRDQVVHLATNDGAPHVRQRCATALSELGDD